MPQLLCSTNAAAEKKKTKQQQKTPPDADRKEPTALLVRPGTVRWARESCQGLVPRALPNGNRLLELLLILQSNSSDNPE